MTSRKRKLRRRNDIPMNPEPLPGTTDRRVARLLRLLAKNATIVISGTRIAREIGVSRSAVWQWVERLRELGVRVKGQAATGYFLEKVPDILTGEGIKAGPKRSPLFSAPGSRPRGSHGTFSGSR